MKTKRFLSCIEKNTLTECVHEILFITDKIDNIIKNLNLIKKSVHSILKGRACLHGTIYLLFFNIQGQQQNDKIMLCFNKSQDLKSHGYKYI